MRAVAACLLVLFVSATALAAAASPQAGSARKAAAPYRPGQHVNFYASHARCTGAFVVRFAYRGGSLPAALTAGHCSSYPRRSHSGYARERVWRVHGVNRGPATDLGITLANSHGDGPDALAFSIGGAGSSAQRIDRGRLGSVAVKGSVASSRQRRGMRVCFTGRASATHCGRLTGGHRRSGSARLTCATMHVQGGDSGGPVYTVPRAGRTKAVGLVAVARLAGPGQGMCFTPIATVLRKLGARLAG